MRLRWVIVVTGVAFALGFGVRYAYDWFTQGSTKRPRRPTEILVPVQNGPIAFVSRGDLVTVGGPRGSGRPFPPTPDDEESDPAWSPDGTKLAFTRSHARNIDVYVFDEKTKDTTRVTEAPGRDAQPSWAPDGRRLAFVSDRAGSEDIYVVAIENFSVQRLTSDSGAETAPTWSPDGLEIAFESDRAGNPDVDVMRADGLGRRRLVATPAAEREPAWSPDGRRLAYVAQAGDRTDLHRVNADGSGRRRLIRMEGTESQPAWSPDGTELVFATDREHPGSLDLYSLDTTTRRSRVRTARPGDEANPSWRPRRIPGLGEPKGTGPIARYAPVVYLHPQERYWPMRAREFIEGSGLIFRHTNSCSHRVRPRGRIVPRRLGAGSDNPYEHPAGCGDRGRIYAASDYTRPHTGTAKERKGLPRGEGFFLNFPPGFQSGTTTTSEIPGIYLGSPVYYQYAPRHFVTYFFFYAFSRAFRLGNHQGDWERISVCLDARERATGVIYYQHQSRAPIPWRAVGKFGNHPIVYSARGSHASYLTAGAKRFPNDDREEGLIWATWRELINVFEQPWYGFGGAWGKARAQSDFTGPLGPSQHGDKGGAPCATTVEAH